MVILSLLIAGAVEEDPLQSAFVDIFCLPSDEEVVIDASVETGHVFLGSESDAASSLVVL